VDYFSIQQMVEMEWLLRLEGILMLDTYLLTYSMEQSPS